MESEIRVGTAGWAYEDWEGIVYPDRKPPRFDPLAWLAGYFDCIEINSSFYRIPSAPSAPRGRRARPRIPVSGSPSNSSAASPTTPPGRGR